MLFEWLRADAVSPDFVVHWRNLGLRSSTPNIYLMPEFVLPAIRHLEAEKSPLVAALWSESRSALLAVGIFNAVAPSWRFPFPRLSTIKSRHSFQSGLLLHADADADSIDTFLHESLRGGWRAIRIQEMREDTVLYGQLQESARRLGLRWFVDARYERAALHPHDTARWHGHISPARHQRLRGSFRKLSEIGRVEFRVVRGNDISEESIDTFLRLESMGWKQGSSLLATTAGERFFRGVSAPGAGRDLLWVCELLLDGTPIASTINFAINSTGFAFKVGFDTTYARYSPGLLVEYEFLKRAQATCPYLAEVDSGAYPGSFIESLWPERIPIVSGHLVAPGLPTMFTRMKTRLRRFIAGSQRAIGRGKGV